MKCEHKKIKWFEPTDRVICLDCGEFWGIGKLLKIYPKSKEYREKILKLAKETDISKLSLRKIAMLTGIEHPESVRLQINKLKEEGLL